MIDQESLSSLTQCTNVQVTNQNPHVQLDCRSLWSFYLEIFQGNDKSETNTFFLSVTSLAQRHPKILETSQKCLGSSKGWSDIKNKLENDIFNKMKWSFIHKKRSLLSK